MLHDSRYGVLAASGKFAVVNRSGLRRGVEPGMLTFIERDPTDAFPLSIVHVPPVPPEIDHPVGVPAPDSKDPFTATSGADSADSR